MSKTIKCSIDIDYNDIGERNPMDVYKEIQDFLSSNFFMNLMVSMKKSIIEKFESHGLVDVSKIFRLDSHIFAPYSIHFVVTKPEDVEESIWKSVIENSVLELKEQYAIGEVLLIYQEVEVKRL